MIGNPDNFALDLDLDPTHELADLGWGSLKVIINRETVWDAEWTWLDLAEWFASYWEFIVREVNPPNKEDEDATFRYQARHDMAYGMKGIFLPTIWLLPTGSHIDLAYRKVHCSRLPLAEFQGSIEEFMAALLNACLGDKTGRAELVRRNWEKRRSYEI